MKGFEAASNLLSHALAGVTCLRGARTSGKVHQLVTTALTPTSLSQSHTKRTHALWAQPAAYEAQAARYDRLLA